MRALSESPDALFAFPEAWLAPNLRKLPYNRAATAAVRSRDAHPVAVHQYPPVRHKLQQVVEVRRCCASGRCIPASGPAGTTRNPAAREVWRSPLYPCRRHSIPERSAARPRTSGSGAKVRCGGIALIVVAICSDHPARAGMLRIEYAHRVHQFLDGHGRVIDRPYLDEGGHLLGRRGPADRRCRHRYRATGPAPPAPFADDRQLRIGSAAQGPLRIEARPFHGRIEVEVRQFSTPSFSARVHRRPCLPERFGEAVFQRQVRQRKFDQFGIGVNPVRAFACLMSLVLTRPAIRPFLSSRRPDASALIMTASTLSDRFDFDLPAVPGRILAPASHMCGARADVPVRLCHRNDPASVLNKILVWRT